MNAVLALENGTVYRGTAAGAQGIARGEVVFNTSMTGYQEVLTDPSYAGQIVTMTSPQIGNYGVAPDDVESSAPKVAGFIMREESPIASNWRASGTLRDYLVANNVVAIADIDTRELTRLLRSSGVMRGVIATGDVDPATSCSRLARFRRWKAPIWCATSRAQSPFDWPAGIDKNVARSRVPISRCAPQIAFEAAAARRAPTTSASSGTSCGAWRPTAARCTWFRHRRRRRTCSTSDVDGIFLSNGPGDPAAVDYAIENVRDLRRRTSRSSASVSAIRFSGWRSAARPSS